jgi:hypothetical protein
LVTARIRRSSTETVGIVIVSEVVGLPDGTADETNVTAIGSAWN